MIEAFAGSPSLGKAGGALHQHEPDQKRSPGNSHAKGLDHKRTVLGEWNA